MNVATRLWWVSDVKFSRFIWNLKDHDNNTKAEIKVKPSDAEDDSDTQTIELSGADTYGDTIVAKIKQVAI